MLDNHLARQGQEEYQRRGSCSCGGLLEPIEWCIEGEEECYTACELRPKGGRCEFVEDRLLCKKCGGIFECE